MGRWFDEWAKAAAAGVRPKDVRRADAIASGQAGEPHAGKASRPVIDRRTLLRSAGIAAGTAAVWSVPVISGAVAPAYAASGPCPGGVCGAACPTDCTGCPTCPVGGTCLTSVQCDSGLTCSAGVCGGSGATCTGNTQCFNGNCSTSGSPGVCGGTNATCTPFNEPGDPICASTHWCNSAGLCKPDASDGAPCGRDNQCTTLCCNGLVGAVVVGECSTRGDAGIICQHP